MEGEEATATDNRLEEDDGNKESEEPANNEAGDLIEGWLISLLLSSSTRRYSY